MLSQRIASGALALVALAQFAPPVAFARPQDASEAKSEKGLETEEPFTELVLGLSTVKTRTGTRLALKPDGTARLERTGQNNPGPAVDGRVAVRDLVLVKEAFRRARVRDLPKPVPDPSQPLDKARVSLISRIGSERHTFAAPLDDYPGATARVKPLVDALRAIAEKLVPARSEEREATGRVVKDGSGGLFIEESPSSRLRIESDENRLRQILGTKEALRVRVFGRVRTAAGGFGSTIELSWIEGVVAEMRDVCDGASVVTYVATGKRVRVHRVEYGGFYYVLLPGGDTGVMRGLKIGEPATAAPATPAPTSGIADRVPR